MGKGWGCGASSGSLILRRAGVGAVVLVNLLLFAMAQAEAAPRPADGSNCNSDWVNNEDAMQCFINGQEDIRKGVQRPRYVACLPNGEVHCCTDNDQGGQDCEAMASRRQPLDADKIRAILDGQLTILNTLRRISERVEGIENRLQELDRKGSP